MKKIVLIALLFLITAITFVGCIGNEIEIEVNEDGGTLLYTWTVDKENADAYYGDRLPEVIKKAEIIEKEGRPYYSNTETAQYSSLEELSKAIKELCLVGEDGLNLFESVQVSKNRILLITRADLTPADIDGSSEFMTLDLTISPLK